jgi:hypothetical protein
MTRIKHLPRVLVLAALLLGALISSSCVDGSGVGVGVGAPARWDGGAGPPIFVGGPM